VVRRTRALWRMPAAPRGARLATGGHNSNPRCPAGNGRWPHPGRRRQLARVVRRHPPPRVPSPPLVPGAPQRRPCPQPHPARWGGRAAEVAQAPVAPRAGTTAISAAPPAVAPPQSSTCLSCLPSPSARSSGGALAAASCGWALCSGSSGRRGRARRAAGWCVGEAAGRDVRKLQACKALVISTKGDGVHCARSCDGSEIPEHGP
jgi:hypothetical protein